MDCLKAEAIKPEGCEISAKSNFFYLGAKSCIVPISKYADAPHIISWGFSFNAISSAILQ